MDHKPVLPFSQMLPISRFLLTNCKGCWAADPTSGSLQGVASEGRAGHARQSGMDDPTYYGGPDTGSFRGVARAKVNKSNYTQDADTQIFAIMKGLS
jgi:hypothetical protein